MIAHLFGVTVIALTFAASAVSKLRDRGGFVQSIRAFQVLPERLTGATAIALTSAEVAVVGLLTLALLPVFSPFVPYVLGIAAVLLVAYTAGLVSVRARGLHVPCHCFGASPVPVSWFDIARNVLLLGIAGLALAAGTPADPLAGVDAVLVALAGAATTLVVTNLANVVHTVVTAAGTD
ncbi:MauE/DoxX family redox-associated membrane protein [Dactylosporangium sp. CS-033363]|uniref:MauE/DoxX family redox-associated membrane protein n=1 Tax=Dactylosporangium sp. CS-033363 TaxID=3239935 RepID=UPI003D91FB25